MEITTDLKIPDEDIDNLAFDTSDFKYLTDKQLIRVVEMTWIHLLQQINTDKLFKVFAQAFLFRLKKELEYRFNLEERQE